MVNGGGLIRIVVRAPSGSPAAFLLVPLLLLLSLVAGALPAFAPGKPTREERLPAAQGQRGVMRWGKRYGRPAVGITAAYPNEVCILVHLYPYAIFGIVSSGAFKAHLIVFFACCCQAAKIEVANFFLLTLGVAFLFDGLLQSLFCRCQRGRFWRTWRY